MSRKLRERCKLSLSWLVIIDLENVEEIGNLKHLIRVNRRLLEVSIQLHNLFLRIIKEGGLIWYIPIRI